MCEDRLELFWLLKIVPNNLWACELSLLFQLIGFLLHMYFQLYIWVVEPGVCRFVRGDCFATPLKFAILLGLL